MLGLRLCWTGLLLDSKRCEYGPVVEWLGWGSLTKLGVAGSGSVVLTERSVTQCCGSGRVDKIPDTCCARDQSPVHNDMM